MQLATDFEIWANKWCFEMSGNEEKELRWKYSYHEIMKRKLEKVYDANK